MMGWFSSNLGGVGNKHQHLLFVVAVAATRLLIIVLNMLER
jgi:hypothetical protein